MGNWRQRMQKLIDAGERIFPSSPLPFLAWEGDGLLCVREKASGPAQWIWLPHAADDLEETRRVLTETWHVPLHTAVMTASPAAVRYKWERSTNVSWEKCCAGRANVSFRI